MKKVIYLMTLSLIFIYGCNNEDLSGLQDSSSADLKFEKLSFDGKTLSTEWSSITMEELRAKSRSRISSKSSGDSGANGHFSTNEGNTISFSSGENGEFGDWNIRGIVNFKGDVICATVEGNQAVIQVVVKKVGALPDGFPDILGWTFLYLLEDNGEGQNAPSDRYYNQSLYAPFDFGGCVELGPSDFLQIIAGCPCDPAFSDTAKTSDQIQIK